ncbi:FxSxx-COOH cyclophane-containing RiPP peptide [Allonocardiopsis opalescens]|uniref:FxSxx-COOH cyclophane-containing RiPP peptide n=1 Tax=Allonocardiopsis opalescens TaxID=1144618 RepID=UPI000D07C80D|nr:FxSxx-COOH cyclophane-containing RiPP peptide [Allonocardiopsis opalescens]
MTAQVSDDQPISSDLVDLGGIGLAELGRLDDSALAHAIRRVLSDADNSSSTVAGFNSSI